MKFLSVLFPVTVTLCLFTGNIFSQSDDLNRSLADSAKTEKTIYKDEVVVTATRLEASKLDVPADVQVINLEEIHSPGAKSFQNSLTEISGVKLNSRYDNAMFSDIEVRGLTGNGTSGANLLILLDGIPQRRLSFGGPYMGAIPFESVSRMEMVKGPLSSLYGRNALAATLQLFTDPGSQKFQLKAATSFEAETKSERASVLLSGPLPGLGLSTFSLSGGLGIGEGWQERNNSSKDDIYGHFNFIISDNDILKVIAGYYKGNEDYVSPVLIDKTGRRLPGINRNANLSIPKQSELNLREYRMGGVWTHYFTNNLILNATLSYWNGDTRWNYGRPSDAPVSGTIVNRQANIRLWKEDNIFSEFQFQWSHKLNEGIKGIMLLGGSYEPWRWDNSMQSIRASNTAFTQGIPINLNTMAETDPSTWVYGPVTDRNTKETDKGAFIREQLSIKDIIQLQAGVRYDYFKRTQQNITTRAYSEISNKALSPSLGLSFRVIKNEENNLSLYTNWGRGFSPIFRAVGSTEIANVSPEKSKSYEAGLKGWLLDGLLDGSISAYQIERNDVVGTLSGGTIVTNVGDWTVKGIETAIKVSPLKDLSLFVSYTIRDPEVTRNLTTPANTGKKIAVVSGRMGFLAVRWIVEDHLQISLEGRYNGSSYADEANTVSLPSYTLLDSFISWQYKSFVFSIYAKNLFDKEYYSAVDNGVVNGAAYEGLPRTFGISINTGF